MYYLATCDNKGKCFGYLRTDNTVSKNPDDEMDKLLCYKKKSEANEKAMQINLGHMLLPNGADFRVAVVKGWNVYSIGGIKDEAILGISDYTRWKW